MNLGPLPQVYVAGPKRLHTDWVWPFCYIPRAWTGVGLPMPPVQLLGNSPSHWVQVEDGYPLARGAEVHHFSENGPYYLNPPGDYVQAPDPYPPDGCWTIQGVRLGPVVIPCHFAFTKRVFGRRLFFCLFCRPDVTAANWYWWIEWSLTWTKEA